MTAGGGHDRLRIANLVLGLLIDPAGEQNLTRSYAEFSGETRPFVEIVRDSKLRIMNNEMAKRA